VTSNLTIIYLLYLTIVVISLSLRDGKSYIWSAALIGALLLLLDLPDIAEYKEHYYLTAQTSFMHIFPLYNFEPGYVAAVAIFSKIVPFEVFYIIIITLAIDAYFKFYRANTDNRAYILAACFLSLCLYFVAFTLRATIASIFLAYSLHFLRNKKNATATVLIIIGATFHAIIIPLIILPIANLFSAFISKRYLLLYTITVIAVVFVSKLLSLDMLLGVSDVIDLKASAYKDANISSDSVYFVLWIIAIAGFLISLRFFSEFDRVLALSLTAIILALHPYEFIQGRFMWLTSFLFIYILAKGVIIRFNFGKTGRLIFTISVPLITLMRF